MTFTVPFWLYWFVFGGAVAIFVSKLLSSFVVTGFRARVASWAEAERVKLAEQEAKEEADRVIGFAKSNMQDRL